MDGIQKTVSLELAALQGRVDNGVYDSDDDFDADAFREGLEHVALKAE